MQNTNSFFLCSLEHMMPYLLFGQVLLPHDVHVRPDLLLGVRCFAPCAKEHQQEHRTLISVCSKDRGHYKHSKHKHSHLTLTLYQQIKLSSCSGIQLIHKGPTDLHTNIHLSLKIQS